MGQPSILLGSQQTRSLFCVNDSTALPRAAALLLGLAELLASVSFANAVPSHPLQTMKTKDVRVDTELNKFLWSKGIR